MLLNPETPRTSFQTARNYQNPFFFFFNDPATTEFYPLPLPDALPILRAEQVVERCERQPPRDPARHLQPLRMLVEHRVDDVDEGLVAVEEPVPAGEQVALEPALARSEEHTSELQSQSNLVCRLLLEKK